MHPESPTRYSIMYRSEHESQVPHYLRPTYFSSDPSEKPPIDGVLDSSVSETVPFWMNVPGPFPSDLSCDCINSAKYTLSPLYFNRAAVDNEDRSVSAAKVQLRT